MNWHQFFISAADVTGIAAIGIAGTVWILPGRRPELRRIAFYLAILCLVCMVGGVMMK